jgi:Restriction endonuclease
MKEEDLPKEAQEQIQRVRVLEQTAQEAVAKAKRQLAAIQEEIAEERAEFEHERNVFDVLVADKIAASELIAKAWADYERARTKALSDTLRLKGRPAASAAAEVRAKGKELAALRKEAKLNQWIVRLYEWHFPWLADLRDDEEERAFLGGEPPEEDTDGRDPAAHWLSREEWEALSTAERNQAALDRYIRSRKSAWQLGRDYERYIGYLREADGWNVNYHGIFKGLEDLGRDLICVKGDEVEVIQAKRWSKHKTIHERHVFQLFGTSIAARIEHPGKRVRATFITTTKLSERAHQFADQLDVAVEESLPLDDYPRIKCNIARRDGERIYHLPFDQRYDDTLVEPERGEFWAWTCAEAEEAGFRRAWRWRGDGGESPTQREDGGRKRGAPKAPGRGKPRGRRSA